MSSIIQHHKLIERQRWKFFSTFPRVFSWDYRCELRVLLILLQVKVASSVNRFNGSIWWLVGNQWQKCRCMALSSGCRFCTGCGWNWYKSFSYNVCNTCARETPIHAECLRVIIVGLPYQEWFPVPPCFDYVPVQIKHEHWEAYCFHALYWTPCETLYDPEFCPSENVDGILQKQQWHCHRRSHKHTSYQHTRHLWRCAAFFTIPQQCHYQQSLQPTEASHRFTCFRSWRSKAGGKDITGRPSQSLYCQMPLSQKPLSIGQMFI